MADDFWLSRQQLPPERHHLAAEGAVELTLIAQDTTRYGHDLDAITPGGVKRLIPPTTDLEALPPPFADR